MFKKLSDTLSALVAEYCNEDGETPAKGSGGGGNIPAHRLSDDEPPVAPITRAELIRQAMEIRDTKARELENLTPTQRRRLRELAEKLMLGEPPADAPGTPGAKPRTRH